MSGMLFGMTDEGTSELVAKRLEASGARANELLPVMERIAQDMFRIEESLFHSGGRRGGGSWKKLQDSTIKRKGSAVILVETGELKASLTERGHQHNILEITNNGVLFGTSDPLGAVHTQGQGGLPKRPVIKFAGYDYARWNRWIKEFLVDGI